MAEYDWDKRAKLATLFGLWADGFPHPNELGAATRELLGLPKNLPAGGYSSEDTKLGVVEGLATVLSEVPRG